MQLSGTIAFQKPKIGKAITNKNSKYFSLLRKKLMKIGGVMASKYFFKER
jgi:hypothetical protein